MRKYTTPEEAETKRAYAARVRGVKSGQIVGLFERDGKSLLPDVRALIDEALSKRDEQAAEAAHTADERLETVEA